MAASVPSSVQEKARRVDWAFVLVAAAAAAVLFPMLAKSGIWDPYELDASDLARRIAIHRFGAPGLALPGAVNALPTLTDLRMGELPFTSMAVAFRVLGLRDWTGRLPLALWGFAAVLVLYAMIARLVHRRAGVYAAVALLTMPLFFMQARTMLGDIVTIAAATMAFAGLVGVLADAGRARLAWAALAIVGVLSGYLARGLLIGVAIPLLGVGSTWLVVRASGAPGASAARARDALGAALLVAGLVALALGLRVLFRTAPDAPLPRALGVALLKKPPAESTFDLTIRQLGHGLFPWSAFLPFAFGRLFRAPGAADGAVAEPSAVLTADARARETFVRAALLCGSGVAFAVYALLAPFAGALVFSAPALLAAVAGVVIYDFERDAPPSRALGLGCLLFGFVLYRDFAVAPEKAFVVFSVDRAVFPKGFERAADHAMLLVYALFAGLVALSWFERPTAAAAGGLRAWALRVADDARAFADEIAHVWAGNLLFAGIVVEAAFIGLGAMIAVGRRIGWPPVMKLQKSFADPGVHAWWVVPLVAVSVPLALRALRDGFRFVVNRARMPRAAYTAVAAAAAGCVLGFWYYPALAAQLSPKEGFESYAQLHGSGEPLGLFGVRTRAAVYYGGEVESFSDAARAFAWLTERMDARRWMLIKSEDLPRLNANYRQLAHRNLPVLDARSNVLLVSNQLGGRPNENPLARIVLDDPPHPVNTLDAAFEDELEVIGWEVTDEAGRPMPAVEPRVNYRLRTYYRVLKPVPGSWKAFLHIDGYQRRYNGDHAVLEGRYPINLWQPGDVLLDDHEFQLEPNFTPGAYTIYFGFFSGETRFRVSRGPEQDNRVIAGTLRVR